MGKGNFFGEALDLYVSFDDEVAQSATGELPDDVSDLLRETAHRFYEATDGKIYIRNIFWIDDGWGKNIADVFFRNTDNGSVLGQAHLNGLGVFGAKSETFRAGIPISAPESLAATTVHELGHYLWGLGDEYAGPTLTGPIDLGAQESYDGTASEYRSVFLSPEFDLTNPITEQPYNLVDCDVLLFFDNGEILESRIAQEAEVLQDGSIELRIIYSAGFTSAPSLADDGIVYIRPSAICSNLNARTCIMGGRGGNLVNKEFCISDNHEEAKSTAQSFYHNGSPCWETIAQWINNLGEIVIAPPNPNQLDTGTPPPEEAPSIQMLSKEHRIVLVLDRSGSMAENEKIEGARAGLEFWVSNIAVESDFLGLIWFDHEIEPLLDIQQVSQISDLDAKKDEILALNPRGSTNIRDALDQAADMLIQEAEDRGPAIQQFALLLTDGMHNVPPPSTAVLDVIDKFKENGIQIYTVGFGTSETVDRTVLEDLAYRTAGRPVMDWIDGDSQTVLPIQSLLALLKDEIRGESAANVVIELGELTAGAKTDVQFRKWKTANVRPELNDILKVASVSKLSEFKANEPDRVVLSSMWVEKGAQSASFSIHTGAKSRVWIYLVAPDGTFLPLDQGRWFTGRYPFEGVVVPKPAYGRWTVVIVRPEPGPAFKARFLGGIKNRELVVSGDSDKVVPLGSGCRIWARANWGDDLSGLSVGAKIRDPEGTVHHLILDDRQADEPSSGLYQAFFIPSVSGHHSGEIQIFSKGKVKLAAGLDRMLHADYDPKKGHQLDLSNKKDRFVRRISFYFDAGVRPVPKDVEKAIGLIGKFRKPKRFGKPLPFKRVEKKELS